VRSDTVFEDQQMYSFQSAPTHSLAEIKEATNKACILDNDRFKQRIQERLERRVEPKARGRDRKSEQFNVNRNLSVE